MCTIGHRPANIIIYIIIYIKALRCGLQDKQISFKCVQILTSLEFINLSVHTIPSSNLGHTKAPHLLSYLGLLSCLQVCIAIISK